MWYLNPLTCAGSNVTPDRFEYLFDYGASWWHEAHGVKSIVMADRIIGCPHEEGIDYPDGQVCPQCPFWAHRDRWSGDVLH